ncbi:Crp/Fnr family transcriptional regulator [Desulfosporosinus sp. PR]|uniref:Crp/Fnr family transcriptional regulator n=1 Tax=Candidatus Desulfosporosinus nitrosoreducens TaxID=3401928 RepID=UPI0027EF5875|nr:Crp/Fnr family transcriptional regulator [Desulfosporosinus sp. PR]MDQ7094591.1 Crp/Fnr family transcriptional regulator [Desulfosporosinus sp. PR]
MENERDELAKYITQSVLIGVETLRSEEMPTDIWEDYLSLGSRAVKKKGEHLVRSGENLHGLYFIDKGRLKTSIISQDGTIKTLSINSEKTIVLSQFVFHQQPGIIECVVLEDSELYFFTQEIVLHLMKENFAVALYLAKNMAIVSRILATQIQDTICHVQQSLARILYSVYCYEQRDGKLKEQNTIAITHEELANFLGAHRVTITKALNQLKHLGVIDYKYEKIIILHEEELKALAFTV